MDFVWMKHPGGTEPAQFAPDAVEFWQARGWEPVEKPEEPDPTAEPRREAPPPPAERAAETTTGDLPVRTKPTTAGRQRGADAPKE
ncbi:hypothetical protein [Micromonospora sp. NBRC 107095]|uniref:hypothetical protein n=1 Tax=Micromonospora sp. NBRC 107095 TaxID=3032209 RepID=UPI0024A5697A|nr:hypothetical protein [Micromonospora sp. NBRC 107095]GLZ62878.1 hypothetical protein Misp05_64540 [Micromonospora sp. NBRC 107095]